MFAIPDLTSNPKSAINTHHLVIQLKATVVAADLKAVEGF